MDDFEVGRVVAGVGAAVGSSDAQIGVGPVGVVVRVHRIGALAVEVKAAIVADHVKHLEGFDAVEPDAALVVIEPNIKVIVCWIKIRKRPAGHDIISSCGNGSVPLPVGGSTVEGEYTIEVFSHGVEDLHELVGLALWPTGANLG